MPFDMSTRAPVAVSGQTFRKFADAGDVSDSVHSSFGDAVKGGGCLVREGVELHAFDFSASMSLIRLKSMRG